MNVNAVYYVKECTSTTLQPERCQLIHKNNKPVVSALSLNNGFNYILLLHLTLMLMSMLLFGSECRFTVQIHGDQSEQYHSY